MGDGIAKGGALQAELGDKLFVPSERVGQADRRREIVKVIGGRLSTFFRVHWDNDHGSILCPWPDTRIES